MSREMKDSGVEWIGEIPKKWKISKVKYFVKCFDGKRIPIDIGERKPGPYPYWGAGSITDCFISLYSYINTKDFFMMESIFSHFSFNNLAILYCSSNVGNTIVIFFILFCVNLFNILPLIYVL